MQVTSSLKQSQNCSQSSGRRGASALWQSAWIGSRQITAPSSVSTWNPIARPWIDAFARAHRGLFRAREAPEEGAHGDQGDGWILEDVWGGVELYARAPDDGMREAILASIYSKSLFDGRVVARDDPA